jgi:signal transduction histidine kinase
VIICEFLTLFIIIVWLAISVMSYEFYTTAKINRFRFRYWFAISMLNVFQAIVGAVVIYSSNQDYQTARWVAFVLIDALYLEIFIPPIARRKIELFVRTIFYLFLAVNFMMPNPFFLLVDIVILMVLTRKSEYNVLRKHFSVSMAFYFLAVLLPHLFGYTGDISLLIGLVFSTHLAYGVYKLYKEEQTAELIKQAVVRKIREEQENE